MKPQRFYGLHMVEGVAEYREPGKDSYRILVNENAIKSMDPTFDGLPVYVHHVDEVNLDDLGKADPKTGEIKEDGYVIRSFFNQADGKHWAEFLVVTEKGYDAIVRKKWKLSNAYIPREMRGGGQWHGVDYAKEVVRGEYEHLAIVPNPRYAESIILTPEQFKAYNEDKEIELSKLKNSKEENKKMSKFKFWKREKVENSTDLEGVHVTLPKSGKEISIETLIKNADDMQVAENSEDGIMANGDHKVMFGEHKMSVNELVEKHKQACNELEEMKKKNVSPGEDEAAKKKALELAAHEEKEMAEKKANEEAAAKAAEEEKKKNGMDNFNKLKNAQDNAKQPEVKIDLSMDQVQRGQKRYGSN